MTVDVAYAVSEKVFQLHVLDYGRMFGWKVMHISDSRRSYSRGFFDCVFAKEGRVIFAELKKMKGKLTPAQEEWRDAVKDGPNEYYLWRPDSWDEIERVLGPGETT